MRTSDMLQTLTKWEHLAAFKMRKYVNCWQKANFYSALCVRTE